MTTQSVVLEQLVERIHRLLKEEDAIVTWNDKIPDPDNLQQAWQIDVTIRRHASLTLVECRTHKSPQDVTWIEELIGRRISLKADLVIAVSSSGFTEGARYKAKNYGIVLRDFQTLSREEIRNWGRHKEIQLNFLEFIDAVLEFSLPQLPSAPFTILDQNGDPIFWHPFFREIMNQLDHRPELKPNQNVNISLQVDNPFFVNGVKTLKVGFSAKVRRIIRNIELASVVAYADPINRDVDAKAGNYLLGTSEIIEAGDQVSLVTDLTDVEFPPNSFLDTINYNFGRVVTVRRTQFIGVEKTLHNTAKVRFRFSTSGSAPKD